MRQSLEAVFKSIGATTLVAACVLSACTKQEPAPATTAILDEPASELKWARAALERNPDLKVVSIDAEKNSIKVTIKATGETATLTPGELAAIPIGDLVALTNAANATKESPAPKVVEEPIPPTPQAEAVPEQHAATDYKVERQDGRMRITGPGVSIESSDPRSSAAGASAAPKIDQPIICEGTRMMHLDRRHLNVDGDAIIVRGGCELHLTNSEISATGTAIVVEDGTIHVGNSLIKGGTASFDAGSQAKMFLSNNRFTGTARRDTQAKINDQGGNIWR